MSSAPAPRPATKGNITDYDVQASEVLSVLIGREFGLGTDTSYARAAGELGCLEGCLRELRSGVKHARLGLGLGIVKLMGPAAVNELLAVIGYGGAVKLEDEAVNPFVTLAEINATGAALAQALADTKLDHNERPVIARMARQLSAVLDEQAADLERGA